MNELSLFTGAGGGLLGTKLLGFNHIGYVEYNEYCQKIIAQRIKDGILDEAPIFGDIRTFISEGYAESYQGLVDVITSGFPCQPFSVAGKQQGEDDERNMWPATIDVIRTVRPRFALLENVPGLLAHEYARTIFRDLAESGYECRWRILSAAEVGAPHKRDRIFIVANDHGQRGRLQQELTEREEKANTDNNSKKESLADASMCSRNDKPTTESREHQRYVQAGGCSGDVANTTSKRSDDGLPRETCSGGRQPEESNHCCCGNRRENPRQGMDWWSTEPNVGRVANGVAHRVDRLKALGNGQVPTVVRAAWHLLTSDL